MDVGPAELMIVLLIALLIFGGAQLPKLARSMGEAASEFRKGVRGDDEKKNQTAKSETAKSETAKSETAKSETAKSETAKDQTANDEHDGGTEAADVGNERSA